MSKKEEFLIEKGSYTVCRLHRNHQNNRSVRRTKKTSENMRKACLNIGTENVKSQNVIIFLLRLSGLVLFNHVLLPHFLCTLMLGVLGKFLAFHRQNILRLNNSR